MVPRPGVDGDGVARERQRRPAADPEPHAALQHREALLLLGVGVAAGNVPAGSEDELEHEQRAARLGRRPADDDPLAGDLVLDDPAGGWAAPHMRSLSERPSRRRPA